MLLRGHPRSRGRSGESYSATALRAGVRQQVALLEWSVMADAVRVGAEGLLVRRDYRRPVVGSADPGRVDLTWPAFLEEESNPGEEGLLPVAAQLLGRLILLINANTTPPFVGMLVQLPPTATDPLGRRIAVHRRNRTFQYRPHVRSRPRNLPQSTVVLANRAGHYTTVVTTCPEPSGRPATISSAAASCRI